MKSSLHMKTDLEHCYVGLMLLSPNFQSSFDTPHIHVTSPE